MNNGIYTAYSGLKARSDALEITANNLANLNTVGFKKDRSFGSYLTETIKDSGPVAGLGVAVSREVRTDRAIDFSDGMIVATGRNLDVALRGDGFLTVETPNGVRYTRNGNMYLDANSTLRTADGHAVLGAGGGQITLESNNVNIAKDGAIFLNGEEVARLGVVAFQDASQVEKEGEALFAASGGATPAQVANVDLLPGFLEQANVNAVTEVVGMINILRQFESIQKTINMELNDMDSKVIDRLGR